MRILITPEWYPDDDRRSFGAFCREQAHAVARRHEVVVLAWRLDPELRAPFRIDERVEEGVRTFRLRFGHVPLPKADGALKLAGISVVLARLHRSGWTPDVIHAHEYPAGRPALLLSRVLGAPVVVSEHYSGFALGRVPERERVRARRVFERAATVCPVSHDLERRLREIAPSARFESVPNVVDDDVFRPRIDAPPAVPNGRRIRLVTVGALIERKGHRDLIEALPQMQRGREVTLDVVGYGPLQHELCELAHSLGVEDRVRFLGQQRKEEVAQALRDADIFVLPSLAENMPCALLEALACGLPAVASRVGGVPEVLDETRGVAVPPGSAAELAAGVETVASRLDRYDRARIAADARSSWGYGAIAERWTNVYTGALRAGRQ